MSKPRIFSGRPSTDGLGVKRWRHKLSDFVTLCIFERPESVLPRGGRTYLIRLDHADGRCLDTRKADFRGQARDKAEWLTDRAERGEYGAPGSEL